MKKYLSNSNIWAPILSFMLFLVGLLIVKSLSWLDSKLYLIICVGMSLLATRFILPEAKDLDFIGSTNAGYYEYLMSLVMRNLWFNGFCLVFAFLVSKITYGNSITFDFLVFPLLFVANSFVIIGIRLERYEVIIAYCLTLILGLVIPYSFYLIIIAFVSMGFSYQVYTTTMKERDLV